MGNKITGIIIAIAYICVIGAALSKLADSISDFAGYIIMVVGAASSLLTLLTGIQIKKEVHVLNSSNTISEVKQPNTRSTVVKPRSSSSYYQFNQEVKEFLKKLPKYFANHIFIILSLFVAIILLFISYFNDIACHFYGITKDANGQLLTVFLTVIGGIGAIIVLFQTNKRIREQTRQNNIAINSSNDKRFCEAIGYLNSENGGVSIGGAYALFQLAKEDKRYLNIVANVFVDVFYRCSYNANAQLYATIVNLMFHEIFNNQKLEIQGGAFENITIRNIASITFTRCIFKKVIIEKCNYGSFINCQFNNVHFEDINFIIIERSNIDNCILQGLCNIDDLIISDSKISSSIINSYETITSLLLRRGVINQLQINSPVIEEAKIEMAEISENTTIRTNTPNNIKYIGNALSTSKLFIEKYEKRTLYCPNEETVPFHI